MTTDIVTNTDGIVTTYVVSDQHIAIGPMVWLGVVIILLVRLAIFGGWSIWRKKNITPK